MVISSSVKFKSKVINILSCQENVNETTFLFYPTPVRIDKANKQMKARSGQDVD